MTARCRHPGCLRVVAPANVSGVCRAHLHGLYCRCAACIPPATGRLSDADRRRLSAARSLAGAEGVTASLFPTDPEALKGTP